jgi:hypothetical protein
MSDPVLRNALSVMGTLAFCIPGPWGVVTSAALQSIGFLLPGDARDPVIDAVKQSTSDIETYMAQHALSVDAGCINTIKNWLSVTEKIQDLYTNPAALTNRIKALDPLDDVPSTVDQTFEDLAAFFSNPKAQPPDSAYRIGCAALASYAALRVAVAQCLSLRVSLWQALGALYAQSDRLTDQAQVADAQNNIEATFDVLVAYLRQNLTDATATANIQSTLDALKNFRVGQVQAVQDDLGFFQPTISFKDDGDPTKTYSWDYKTDRWAPGPNGQFFPGNQAAIMATAQAAQTALITKLKTDADDFANEVQALIAKAQDIWARTPKLPAPPQNAPAVDTFDTSWPDAWQHPGKYVQYAFYYLSRDGRTVRSPLGPTGGAPFQCSQADTECPHVSFPADPSGLAASRILIRRVGDDVHLTNAVEYTVPVPNMQDDFYDLWPATPSDVAPNALSAPVIVAWAHDRRQTGPQCTWPNPAPVRYRYKYTRGTMKSLAWSPWSVMDDPAGATIDAQGYVTESDFYSALMQVPEMDGCDFVLQRQFKGGPILDIKCVKTKGNLGAQPTIWLEDAEGP